MIVVVGMRVQVLVKLVSSPYTYMDKAAGVVQDAAYLQATLSGQEADAASIPISHIDGERVLRPALGLQTGDCLCGRVHDITGFAASSLEGFSTALFQTCWTWWT